MIVGDRSSGHRLACQPAHRVGVVLVLDAKALIQGRAIEIGDVARSVDIGMARA